MNFGEALEMLKQGKRTTRQGWNGKGMWIDVQFPLNEMTLPYIYMRTAQGHLVPWVASQTDIFANDWVVLD